MVAAKFIVSQALLLVIITLVAVVHTQIAWLPGDHTTTVTGSLPTDIPPFLPPTPPNQGPNQSASNTTPPSSVQTAPPGAQGSTPPPPPPPYKDDVKSRGSPSKSISIFVLLVTGFTAGIASFI